MIVLLSAMFVLECQVMLTLTCHFQEEYYQRLAEKIYKIRLELKEKRKQRQAQEMQKQAARGDIFTCFQAISCIFQFVESFRTPWCDVSINNLTIEQINAFSHINKS